MSVYCPNAPINWPPKNWQEASLKTKLYHKKLIEKKPDLGESILMGLLDFELSEIQNTD